MERLFSISVKVVVSILFQKARKVLNNERGEANYFSTVVFIFIAVLLLAFIIDLFSIISTKQELDHAADQMVKQIQLSGGVNGETDELFEFLSSQIEGAENISYSIDATYTSPRPSGMTNANGMDRTTPITPLKAKTRSNCLLCILVTAFGGIPRERKIPISPIWNFIKMEFA